MASPRTFSIRMVTQDLSTSIQVRDQKDVVVLNIPVDPMDNTVPAVISAEALKRLGDSKEQVLKLVSDFMLNQVGAKRFLVVPAGTTLTGFAPAEESKAFERLRHCSHKQLTEKTAIVLSQYSDLTAKLDAEFKLTASEASVFGEEGDRHYRENCAFLEGHAQFLPSKMAEYKEEAVAGMMVRCKNRDITPIRMEEAKSQHLSGFMRAFRMNEGFAYLSDETVNQNILSLTLFAGSNPEEQAKNRNIFLLAYLMNRASSKLVDQQQFIIIAARGREAIYEALGFEKFPRHPADGYILLVGPPGAPQAELLMAKTILLQNVAHLRAASKPVQMDGKGARLFSGTAHLWPEGREASDVRSNSNDSYRYNR